MDKDIEQKIAKLKKSLYENIQKASKKDVVKDVLDTNNIAEVSPDDIAPAKTSTVRKSKDEEECGCEEKSDCKCDEAPAEESGVHKSEKIIRNIIEGFDLVSQAYILKKDEEMKTKLWTGWKDQADKYNEAKDLRDKKDEQARKLNRRDQKRRSMKEKRVDEAKQNAKELKDKGINPKFDPMAASEKTEDCK